MSRSLEQHSFERKKGRSIREKPSLGQKKTVMNLLKGATE